LIHAEFDDIGVLDFHRFDMDKPMNELWPV
jgi:hypothetical protein